MEKTEVLLVKENSDIGRMVGSGIAFVKVGEVGAGF